MQGSGIAVAGGLVSQALKMAVLIYLARVYGANEFGSFSFAYSVNAFLYVIAQFGLATYAAREVAQAGHLDPRLYRSVTIIRLALALCGAAVALAVLSVVPQVTREELWLVAGFGLTNVALACLSDWVFQGMGKLHGWAALNITWQGTWLLITVVAVRAQAPIRAASFAYAAGALAASLAGWIWWRRRLVEDGRSTDTRHSVRHVLRQGAHLGAGTMLQTFLVWIDIIVVRMLLGQHGAGLYAAGNRIALGLAMLAGFYMQGAFPLLARAALEDPVGYKRCFQQTYNNLSSIFVPGAVWGIFYAPEILDLLYKRPEYSASVPVFEVFQVVLILTVFGVVFYGFGVLLAFRRDRTFQQDFTAASVVYLLACPFLTWRWGITGAAVAALLAQLILFALFEIQVRRFVVPGHLEALLQPCLLGLGATLFARLLSLSLFPALFFLALAYGVLAVRYLRVASWRPATDHQPQVK